MHKRQFLTICIRSNANIFSPTPENKGKYGTPPPVLKPEDKKVSAHITGYSEVSPTRVSKTLPEYL